MTKAMEREIQWNIWAEMHRKNLYNENKEKIEELMPAIIKAFKKGSLAIEVTLMKDKKPFPVKITNWTF